MNKDDGYILNEEGRALERGECPVCGEDLEDGLCGACYDNDKNEDNGKKRDY